MAEAIWEVSSAETAPIRAEAEVVRNVSEGASSWRLVLRVPDWPGFQPGQFAMLSPGAQQAARRTDPLLPRPMALYRAQAAVGGCDVEILYKIVGRGTALLAEASPGQRVAIVGPLGKAFPPPRSGERVIVVAGGTGIASVFELVARLAGAHPVEVLFGARTAERPDGPRRLRGFGNPTSGGDRRRQRRGARSCHGSARVRTRRPERRAPILPGSGRRVYVCGPTAMMRRCAEIASRRKVPCVAALENAMACGFGVCLGCAAPLRRRRVRLWCVERARRSTPS